MITNIVLFLETNVTKYYKTKREHFLYIQSLQLAIINLRDRLIFAIIAS